MTSTSCSARFTKGWVIWTRPSKTGRRPHRRLRTKSSSPKFGSGSTNRNHRARTNRRDNRAMSTVTPLLVVGSVAIDSITTPFGSRERSLGGSGTHFSVSASFFTDVGVVAVIGEDFTAEDEAVFRERRINTENLQRIPGGKTFRWVGEYGFDLNTARTLDTQLNVFADFNPRLSDM